MLWHLGIVLEFLGVVVLVKWINKSNQPSSFLCIDVDTPTNNGIFLAQVSDFLNRWLELANKETVVDQVVACQEVNILLNYFMKGWHVRLQGLYEGNLLHVLSKIVIFQRHCDVTILIQSLAFSKAGARLERAFEVEPDANIEVFEKVVHHDDVRSSHFVPEQAVIVRVVPLKLVHAIELCHQGVWVML